LSGRTIYDLSPADLLPIDELAELLREQLVGVSLGRLPLRSRSKAAKILVCNAMGYPAPASFKRTRPRFPAGSVKSFVSRAGAR
jgi:hypothetical protein